MKKVSAIILSLTLLLLAMVPFASADDFSLKLTVGSATVDKDGIANIPVTFENTEGYGLMEVKLTVQYDADKLEFIVPMEDGEIAINGKETAKMTTEGNWKKVGGVQTPMTPGAVTIASVNSSALSKASGTLYQLQFKLKDGVEYGDEFEIKLVNVTARLASVDDDTPTDEFVPEVEDGTITVAEPTPVTTTTGDAGTTAAPGTTGTTPTKTGDSTPWSLLAVAALASAGLVVMTMKRK